MISLIDSTAVKWIAIAAIVLGFALAGWYITGLRADLAVATENAKKLTEAVQTQQTAMDKLKQDHDKIAKAYDVLRNQDRVQQRELKELRDKFNQSSSGKPRDVGVIAERKPGLVENIINKGTRDAMRCLEIATGSPLTKEELNASKQSEFNSSCPRIANPKYTGADK